MCVLLEMSLLDFRTSMPTMYHGVCIIIIESVHEALGKTGVSLYV